MLEKAGEQCHYFGILNETELLTANKARLDQNMCINLQANTGGLPLHHPIMADYNGLWPVCDMKGQLAIAAMGSALSWGLGDTVTTGFFFTLIPMPL